MLVVSEDLSQICCCTTSLHAMHLSAKIDETEAQNKRGRNHKNEKTATTKTTQTRSSCTTSSLSFNPQTTNSSFSHLLPKECVSIAGVNNQAPHLSNGGGKNTGHSIPLLTSSLPSLPISHRHEVLTG